MFGGNTSPVGGGSNTPGDNFFIVSHFRKNAFNYAKPVVEPYICDNLNQTYRFFSFLTKKLFKTSFKNVLENRLEGNRLISFVHL